MPSGQQPQRVQAAVDRRVELTARDSRRSLGPVQPVQPVPLAPLEQEVAAPAPRPPPRRAVFGIHIETKIQYNATVEGDADLLRRALSNLVDKEVDFSPQGDTVTITLQRAPAMPP